MYVKVVLRDSTREFDKKYTYSVPDEDLNNIFIGTCVDVPFGRGNTPEKAFVVEITQENETGYFIKQINKIYYPSPMITKEQLTLAEKMTKKYSSTYGDAIRLMIPPDTDAGKRTSSTAYLLDEEEATNMVSEGDFTRIEQLRVVEFLLEYGQSLQSDILSACRITKSTLNTLRKKKIVEFGKSISSIPQTENEYKCEDTIFDLTDEQKKAIDKITSSNWDKFNRFLLFGITGSGKTEVYLKLVQDNFENGGGTILLVPEISLTPQMTERLENRFGDNVRVLHSRLTPKERNTRWKDILDGKAKIVAGARSAIFAPVHNLKLIIIDEEQESSYKSETHPRYNASDIAIMRLQEKGGVLLEGSATPKVETFYKTKTGESILLELPKRIGSSGIPSVEIVDMREELKSGNRSIFSRELTKRMNESFAANEKVMLFINRRGHSGFYLCRDCGFVPKCTDCSISLTYHSINKVLMCHYCGRIFRTPKTCEKCGSKRIGGFGAGTQQLEEICKKEFPDKKILRMDKDTTTGRGSHAKILKEFETDSDVLIGTQMIAKGHDFPTVTTVGIISADLMLGISDFRASERTFQLLTQAAGRAGRAEKSGHVVIQAYNIDDYSIKYAAKQDYLGFYSQEIIFRRNSQFPPFGVIGIIIVSSIDEREAYDFATRVKNELTSCRDDDCKLNPERTSETQIMEMTKAPIYKIRNRYRYRIVLKSTREAELNKFFQRLNLMTTKTDVKVSYDINPFQML